MATIQEQDDTNQEEQEQTDLSSQQLSTGSDSSGSGGQGGGGAATSSAQYKAPERKGSGRFMNLQKYLNANTGAGERLAGGIQSMAGREAGKVQKSADQASDIGQNIQAERDRLSKVSGYNQQVQQGQAQDLAQNNLEDYTQLRTGQNDLQNIQQQGQQYQNVAESGIGNLQNLADQSKTETGRFNLLRSAYGGGRPGSDYGLGQRRLDQLFLQAEGGGQLNQLQNQLGSQVESAQGQYDQFQDTYGQGVQDIQDQTLSAQQSVSDTLGGFDDQGAGAFGDIYSQLAQQQQNYQQSMTDTVGRAQEQLKQRTLSQDIADQLGITNDTQVGDLDLSAWADRIQAGDSDVTMADVINQQQQTQLGGLQQLAGIDSSSQYLGEKEGSLIGFQGDEFQNAIQDSMTSYDDRFFDKNIYDIIGKQGMIDLGHNVTDEDMTSLLERGTTLQDDLRYLYGSEAVGGGAMRLPTLNVGAENLDDFTSRDQLQNAVDSAIATSQGGDGSYAAAQMLPQLQKYLEVYDKLRGQKINVTPEQDIETGGQFNVQ